MNRLFLLGESWGEAEERERTAFVGPTGYLLDQMLKEAGIRRHECFLTNVFNLKPPGNKIAYLCGPKSESVYGYPSLGLKEATEGSYLRKEFRGELERLADELEEVNPNLVVAFGNTAAWALLGKTTISKLRGTVQLSTHTISGYKVLPTYHPAAIFRQWSIRPIVVADLLKANRESQFSEIRRPERQIWIEPTLEDIYEFDEKYLKPASIISVDIETVGAIVTCIGFAPRPNLGIVIPWIIPGRAGRTYWSDTSTTRKVWKALRDILGFPTPKVFQNGLYDIAFLWRSLRLKVYGAEEDSMLLHHALQPESLKGLGFLGSIYTDEGAWKQMRERKTTIKRED
jgi:uracil-DNA glycosylase